MGWLQTSVRFPEHGKVFTVSRLEKREHKLADMVLELASDMRDDPDKLSEALTALIVHVRPELSACQLYFMDYKLDSASWEIGVLHPSLPIVEPGAMFDREPLLATMPEMRHGD